VISYIPVFLVFFLYFSGIPIAFGLFAASMLYFGAINTSSPVDLIFQKFVTSAQSFPLLAIPFFVMAGSIMNYAGISEKLMSFADVLTGHLPGGLAQCNVLLSMLMGGVSGSANADAAMECKMLVPEMEKRGFSKGFSAAITAASSAVTPVIPPGINLIVYGLIAQVSVGKMFAAGYAPGILMSLCLMVTVHIISKKRKYAPTRARKATLKEFLAQSKESVWALLFPLGIVLGLRIGMFTPSEAGAVAVLYCTLVGIFIYRTLKWEHIPKILYETIQGTSTVVFIIVAAGVFGYYLNWERIPQSIAGFLLNITHNKWIMLVIIDVLLLIIGMFLEGGAALIILAPLLVPVIKSLGVDPIHFGLVCIVNIMIGGLTPPFGSMMFTCIAITRCELGEFVRECMPFIFALLIALVLVTFIPAVSLFIPNLIF
jgi:tripartite ATP-independent transporter DctM subunit